jgi:beta-carotene hydroxylase
MPHAVLQGEHPRQPTLAELGQDLLVVTPVQRLITLSLPFAAMGGYALAAWLGWWPLAVGCVMALSLVTYGSTCHDLVHRNLGLPRRLNDIMLSLIEMLSLRSGTAYRLAHLHHHRSPLAVDDLEGSAAHGSLLGALLNGMTIQLRLWRWAWANHRAMRTRLWVEAAGVLAIIAAAALLSRWTLAPLLYVTLVIGGSWLFPLITVYIPHDAGGETPLTQTRLFRGWFVRLIALDHLYHLEHHLYPQVPHHHWKRLADRLDPYFERAGVRPLRRGRVGEPSSPHGL